MRREEFESKLDLVLSLNATTLLDELKRAVDKAMDLKELHVALMPNVDFPRTYAILRKELGNDLVDRHMPSVTKAITTSLQNRLFEVDCNSIMMFVGVKSAIHNIKARQRFRNLELMEA